jgi:hypothetical protein
MPQQHDSPSLDSRHLIEEMRQPTYLFLLILCYWYKGDLKNAPIHTHRRLTGGGRGIWIVGLKFLLIICYHLQGRPEKRSDSHTHRALTVTLEWGCGGVVGFFYASGFGPLASVCVIRIRGVWVAGSWSSRCFGWVVCGDHRFLFTGVLRDLGGC